MSVLRKGARELLRSGAAQGLFKTSLGEAIVIGTGKRSFVVASSIARVPVHLEDEPFVRQRNQIALGNRIPEMSPCTFVAPNAIVVGDVDLFDKVSIWYGCVLRGDLNNIRVAAFSNIQDKTIVHAARTSPTGLSAATSIGRYVTVGQGCVLRSTTIEHECVIGDKSVLMEGSLVETQSILAPGTVVPPGRLIPSGQLWAGNPARYVRDLTKDEAVELCRTITIFFVCPMEAKESKPEVPPKQLSESDLGGNASERFPYSRGIGNAHSLLESVWNQRLYSKQKASQTSICVQKAEIPKLAESVFELADKNKKELQLPCFLYVDADRFRQKHES